MIKLKSLKLNQLGQTELEGREMNQLRGGNVCTCTCPGPSGTYANGNSNYDSDYGSSGNGNGSCACACRVGTEDSSAGGEAAAY